MKEVLMRKRRTSFEREVRELEVDCAQDVLAGRLGASRPPTNDQSNCVTTKETWIGNNSSPEEVGRDGKCGQDNSALKDGLMVVALSVVVQCV